MELSKRDIGMTKGVAILFMVLLHLFCIKTELPYTPLLWVGSTPFMYYIGLFADCCVVMYCFCSGYAHYLLFERDGKDYYRKSFKRLLKFLLNVWIILALICAAGLVLKWESIPGSFKTFLGNITLIKITYNGSWWFVETYVFLVLLSGVTARIVRKFNGFLLLIPFGVLYIAGFLIRFRFQSLPDQLSVFNGVYAEVGRYCYSIFMYAVGMMFYKYKIFTFLRQKTEKIGGALYVVLAVLAVAAMMAAHGVVQSVVVAPLTGMAVIIILNLRKKGEAVQKILGFFGNHSTNIWLWHMFFYLYPMTFVFAAKYALPVYLFTIAVCLAASWVTNLIYKPLCKLLFHTGERT